MKKYLDYISAEKKRQSASINLIASENYVSNDVLKAQASVFINKYAEGYPGMRYYAGNQVVDEVENWTKDLALQMFGLDDKWQANVQPYSGSPANLAIYLGLIDPGDRILSMNLQHGGHLTHGHKVSFTGKLFDFVHYGVGEDGRLNYDMIRDLALKEKPKLIVAGATAYAREIDFGRFRQIADQVGAWLMADISHIAGLIVAGLHKNCFPYADVVMTTTHKTLRGPRGAIIICRSELSKKIDRAVFPGMQGGPHINSILAKGVAFAEALTDDFKVYQQRVKENAAGLAKYLLEKGVKLVSGGTDNHLVLLDLSDYDYGAAKIEKELETVGIIVNKNTIPNDLRSPMDPSGIRLGVPAVTSRGMGDSEMKKIAEIISQVLAQDYNVEELKTEVKTMTERFQLWY